VGHWGVLLALFDDSVRPPTQVDFSAVARLASKAVDESGRCRLEIVKTLRRRPTEPEQHWQVCVRPIVQETFGDLVEQGELLPTDNAVLIQRAIFKSEEHAYDATGLGIYLGGRMIGQPLVGNDEQTIADALAGVLDQLSRLVDRSQRTQPVEKAVERLVGQVSALLDDRSQLERRLADALGDLHIAQAHVRELEATVRALQTETYETKGTMRLQLVATFALIVATLLGPAVGELTAAALDHDDPVAAASQTAVTVVNECGGPAIIVESAPHYPG
jgi:hypothetical protein